MSFKVEVDIVLTTSPIIANHSAFALPLGFLEALKKCDDNPECAEYSLRTDFADDGRKLRLKNLPSSPTMYFNHPTMLLEMREERRSPP